MNSLRLSKDLNPIRSDSIRFEIKCSGVDSAETAGVTRGGGEAGVEAGVAWMEVNGLHKYRYK